MNYEWVFEILYKLFVVKKVNFLFILVPVHEFHSHAQV
jgi:hypothetical protein